MEYIVQEQAHQKRPTPWPLYLLGVVLILLCVNYVLNLFTPKGVPEQPLLTTNYDDSTTTFSGITFVGVPQQLPSTLPTAQVSTTYSDTDGFERRVKDLYQLKPFPEIPTMWESSEYSLTKISPPTYYVLIRKDTEPISKTISVSDALSTAQKAVDQLFPEEKLSPISQTVKPYRVLDTPHPEPADIRTANAIEVSFGYQFGPYPVFYRKDYTHPVTIIVTAEGKVGKMTVQPFSAVFSEKGSYKTVSLSEALKNIEAGDGAIIYQSFLGSGTPALATILSGRFSSVSIEYRADESSDYLVPYYRFKGTLTNNENVDFEAEVITPAIPIKR